VLEADFSLGVAMLSVARFLRDDDGATAIEYALIAAMVAIVAIGSLQFLGDTMSSKYNYITSSVTGAGS
jgi:pilus assembly protein Flp/PilA